MLAWWCAVRGARCAMHSAHILIAHTSYHLFFKQKCNKLELESRCISFHFLWRAEGNFRLRILRWRDVILCWIFSSVLSFYCFMSEIVVDALTRSSRAFKPRLYKYQRVLNAADAQRWEMGLGMVLCICGNWHSLIVEKSRIIVHSPRIELIDTAITVSLPSKRLLNYTYICECEWMWCGKIDFVFEPKLWIQ